MPGPADAVRAVDSVAAAVSIAGRTILSLDTNAVPADWDHVTKIDPEPDKQLPLAYPLYLQHTSAVSVGGSADVTGETTEETFEFVNAAGVPGFHEPSAARHVTDRTREQADFLAIPEVLNGDGEALVGTLGEGIEYAKEELAPALIAEKLPIPVGEGLGEKLAAFAAGWLLREAVFEAYIIMNPDSAAAREAGVTEEDLLSPREAKRRAMAAEYHLESEVIYLEYSGTYGGEEAVEILTEINEAVSWPRLWYGGGLDDRENARAVLDAGADAVVVGNVFHEIAREEADLYEAAVDEVDANADRETVREWIESRVDPGETSAAQYLSTVVDVPEPERRAIRYLATGVHVGLQLRAVAEEVDEADEATIEEALATERPPGATAFAEAVGDDATGLAQRLGATLVGRATGTEPAEAFAARHLALEL